MGRRAKHKQGDPAPLREPNDSNSQKSSKRKAEDEGPKRSPKKVKATPNVASVKNKGKERESSGKSVKEKKPKDKGKKKDREDSLGWEDVDGDDDNLQAHAASVFLCLLENLRS